MGGKNAIIVDDSADLDEAVSAVRQSAFGYCGQKCSACSRVIVLEGVYEPLLRRLVESTRALVIGDPADPGTDMGPVIDESAAAKIREYIEIGKGEGRLELAVEAPAGLADRVGKPYVGPHIFSNIQPHHRLANDEIFGPVLSVMRARTFAEALEMANATTYKLTGGVLSRQPSHLEAARREFRVGNLYLNRGITGALVGRQPFGGFGLSGVGSKAGGPDYLLHFVEPRSCCENTMRHGFAPGWKGKVPDCMAKKSPATLMGAGCGKISWQRPHSSRHTPCGPLKTFQLEFGFLGPIVLLAVSKISRVLREIVDFGYGTRTVLDPKSLRLGFRAKFVPNAECSFLRNPHIPDGFHRNKNGVKSRESF